MTHKYESYAEFEDRLNKMIQTEKLNFEYKSLLLEIVELGEKACTNGLLMLKLKSKITQIIAIHDR
jgi:hypothetical protein